MLVPRRLFRARFFFGAALGVAALSLPACDGGNDGPCSIDEQTGCDEGQVCEAVEGGEATCFAPVTFEGMVFDSLDGQPIEGARIVARDANDVVVSSVAISKEDGSYSLTVPARRDADGKPLSVAYTLRADASGYQTFPTAPRVGIPIEVTDATGDPPVVKSAATDVGLVPLENASGLGSISGTVNSDVPGGTLVVAGGVTGVADFKGSYVVFNVPAGSAEVRAYAQGVNFTPKTTEVIASMETKEVNLDSSGDATASVSGQVSIVNGDGSSETSIVLAVEETFNETAARGEVPKGLRIGGISGAFEITGVPDGNYVVLAAFENDGLVRDPDTSIGGTSIVHITVSGASQPLAETFKVTGALDVVSPGAEKIEEVSGTPTFVWQDDSGEDHYEIRVFDAFGDLVWEDLAVPGVSGGENVTREYAGPALEPGMIYQFRAQSIKGGGTPLSTTEDLKGVFLYK